MVRLASKTSLLDAAIDERVDGSADTVSAVFALRFEVVDFGDRDDPMLRSGLVSVGEFAVGDQAVNELARHPEQRRRVRWR